ncbi:hypothetical protein AAEO56_09205 [Flavobacterium sp. DGU11]|uniref:Lipoprotein n=1 Tax=Flavobacterium arundinis TaxID=3139143 RepID=A0ABU9HWS8_9FLAO
MKIKAVCIIILFSLLSCKDNKARNETTTQDTIPIETDHPENKVIPAPESKASSDPIDSLKKEFTRINTTSLSKKTYTYKCDELITIDYYYEGDNVVKAVVDFGTVGDHYQKSEFYYRNNKLFFYYDFTEGGPACEGCIVKTEKRYYVQDDKVIKYMKNKEVANCTVCSFSETSLPYRVLSAAETKDFKTTFCK